jgi:predicted dehydrogenase
MKTGVSPRDLRVAIVGVGRMGLRHLDACRRLGMNVCAVADVAPTAVERAVAETDNRAVGYFDGGELIEAARPDALVIATTAPWHDVLTIAAARAGVGYILCEKPMATSLGAAERMVEACRSSGAALAINHQMRFMPHYQAVRALADGPDVGPLVSILVAGSNFGLAMNGSHYFEMFRYITVRSIGSVQAWFDDEQVPNPRGSEFSDRAGRLLARSGDGLGMFIDFVSGAGHGLQTTYVFRNAQVTIDELAGELRASIRRPEHRSLPTTRYGMPADVTMQVIAPAETVESTMAVWRAMLAGEAFPDAEAGLHAMRCLVAAHVSADGGGREVRIDEVEDMAGRVFPWA